MPLEEEEEEEVSWMMRVTAGGFTMLSASTMSCILCVLKTPAASEGWQCQHPLSWRVLLTG